MYIQFAVYLPQSSNLLYSKIRCCIRYKNSCSMFFADILSWEISCFLFFENNLSNMLICEIFDSTLLKNYNKLLDLYNISMSIYLI